MSNRSIYRIERGGVERRIYGAKKVATQEARTLVAQELTDVPTTVPPQHQDWAYDLRRGRLSIYGGLLRFLDHLHRRGVSMETALLIPAWLESYVREVWGDAPEQAVQPIRKVG